MAKRTKEQVELTVRELNNCAKGIGEALPHIDRWQDAFYASETAEALQKALNPAGQAERKIQRRFVQGEKVTDPLGLEDELEKHRQTTVSVELHRIPVSALMDDDEDEKRQEALARLLFLLRPILEYDLDPDTGARVKPKKGKNKAD